MFSIFQSPFLIPFRLPTHQILLLVAATVFLFSCQSLQHPDGRRIWSAKAAEPLMKAGQVIIFMPDDWPPRMTTDEQETYSEWSKMLKDWLATRKPAISLYRADFRTADEVFYGHGLPVNEFTLIFVRQDSMALFCNHPILDPNTYDYIDAFLANREQEYKWQGVQHAGESPTSMPDNLKLVRLRLGFIHPPAPTLLPATPVAEVATDDPAPPTDPSAMPILPAIPVPEKATPTTP